NLNEMQIQAQASAPSVLVQSEAWYPGWRAWVNGQSVPLEQANFLFRGVAVPAGVSSVRVVYEPVTYRFGLFLSLCGLSALGGIVMVQRRKF
ncbi:MAG: YfhO family protein, partial [Abitibacteriaceae bacterium]|nr:YfhO family protein [Abditibacteriaceae bacterium]